MDSIVTKTEENNCSICLEELNEYISLKCNHKFHSECVNKLLEKNCPLCRIKIDDDDDDGNNDMRNNIINVLRIMTNPYSGNLMRLVLYGMQDTNEP